MRVSLARSLWVHLNCYLLLPEEIQVLSIAFLFHLLLRNKAQRSGVNAVAQAGRLRSVIKDVTEMGVALLRAHFRSIHEMTII